MGDKVNKQDSLGYGEKELGWRSSLFCFVYFSPEHSTLYLLQKLIWALFVFAFWWSGIIWKCLFLPSVGQGNKWGPFSYSVGGRLTAVYNSYICTLYTVHCTMYTVHCTLYNVHCTLCTVQCTLYTVHRTLYIVPYSVQCTVKSVQCTIQCAVYSLQSTQYTVN